jgi:trimethylamine:corrinoid methyltransferase-like protein
VKVKVGNKWEYTGTITDIKYEDGKYSYSVLSDANSTETWKKEEELRLKKRAAKK